MKLKLIFAYSIWIFAVTSISAQNKVYKAPAFAENWAKAGVHPDHIILNLTEDPSTSMSVTWRTNTNINSAVAEIAIATAAPKFWRNAKMYEAKTETMDATEVLNAGVVSNYHSVTFTNLIPNTLYAYRVGDGDYWSEWIQFRTAASDENQPFSFLYVGDAQNFIMELWSRLIRQGFVKDPSTNFIIHAGDLINAAHSERQWHEWFHAGSFIHAMVPSFPVTGNHEHQPRTKAEKEQGIRELAVQWRPTFTLPENGIEGMEETVYYVDYQDARIISLNSNKKKEEQVAWLDKVLSENTKKWTVVSFHHPLFSASERRNNEDLRKLWKPVLDKHHVDIVLQGHDHSYARGRTEPDQNMMAGLNKLDHTGTVYVVSVSGGKMYRLRPNAWDDFEGTNRDRAAENTQLIQHINVHNDTLSFEAYTATGELYDAFDIIKQNDKPNLFVERKNEAVAARRHDNTIPYYDPLPDGVEASLMAAYEGYEINSTTYYDTPEFHGYGVRLYKGDERLDLRLDPTGKIIND